MVPFIWFKWLVCLQLVAFNWLHSLGCIHLDAFNWMHLFGCILLVAFIWMHSLGYIQVDACTYYNIFIILALLNIIQANYRWWIWVKNSRFVVLRGCSNLLGSLSKWIYILLRYSRSLFWKEIGLKLILRTIFKYLNIGCSDQNSRHPKCRCPKIHLKMNIGHIFHQNIDRLCLNFTYMDFEGARTNFWYPLSNISKKN